MTISEGPIPTREGLRSSVVYTVKSTATDT